MSSVFKIFSPEDCDFFYDGKFKGHIIGNNDESFRFEVQNKGSYRLKFINKLYGSELLLKLEIGADEEKDIELDFSEVNEVIIKAEAERRRAEEEEMKRREEERKRREEEAERRRHREAELRKAKEEAERRRAEEEEMKRCEEERKRREEEAERRRHREAELRKDKEEAERRKRISSILNNASECRGFSGGLARIKKGNKYGFMDTNGYIVIPFQYDDVCAHYEDEYMYDFHEGLACVCINGKHGFINTRGGMEIPFIYDRASYFSDGIALVRKGFHDEYINKNGIKILELASNEVGTPFYEGLASIGKIGGWGCIDRTGQTIVSKTYDSPIIFSEGLGHTVKDGNHIFIDVKEKIAINLHNNIDWVGAFHEGLAGLQRDKIWYFINMKGKEVIYCNCDWLQGSFHDGMAMFCRNKKYGYIDKFGNEVISCIYDFARDFSEGLALVERNGLYGYINKQGIEVISCVYNCGTGFSEGYAFVKTQDKKWAMIDKLGNTIIAEEM